MRKCLILMLLVIISPALYGASTYQVTPIETHSTGVEALWGYHINEKGSVAGEALVEGERKPFILLADGGFHFVDLPAERGAWATVQYLSQDDALLLAGPVQTDPFYVPYHSWSVSKGLAVIAAEGEPKYRHYCSLLDDGHVLGDYKLGGDFTVDDEGNVHVDDVAEYGLCLYDSEGILSLTRVDLDAGAGSLLGVNHNGDYLFQVRGSFQILSGETFLEKNMDLENLVPWQMNDHCMVVGGAFEERKGQPYYSGAFLWSRDLGLVLLDAYLEEEGSEHTKVTSVNNLDTLVGYVVGGHRSQNYGFLFSIEEGLRDLNDLVEGSSWKIRRATALNDRGQIVALAEGDDGRLYTVLLNPIP